jgi:hypothetical protein
MQSPLQTKGCSSSDRCSHFGFGRKLRRSGVVEETRRPARPRLLILFFLRGWIDPPGRFGGRLFVVLRLVARFFLCRLRGRIHLFLGVCECDLEFKMAGDEGSDGIGQLLIEFDGRAGEAHRRGKSAILPFLQLLGDDIDGSDRPQGWSRSEAQTSDAGVEQVGGTWVSPMDVIELQAERWMNCLAKLLPGPDDCVYGPSSTFGDRSAERSYARFRR